MTLAFDTATAAAETVRTKRISSAELVDLQVPYWIAFASLAGIPATVAPVGLTRDGLPVGIQILAPMWEDATSIEFAALLAERIGGFTPPPAFAA